MKRRLTDASFQSARRRASLRSSSSADLFASLGLHLDDPEAERLLRVLTTHSTKVRSAKTVEALLRPVPSLLARYRPDAARQLLDGYDGFDFRTFAQAYREKVAVRYQVHRVLGLPPTTLRQEDVRGGIDLAQLFVPLRFRSDQDDVAPMSLADLLAARKNVVVLGDPGMGKTTLLGFLALLFAGGAFLKGFSQEWPLVPMFVSLREFVQEQKRVNKDLRFVEYLALRASTDHQLSQTHEAFFDASLRMGEAIVLFDGLDEVGGDAARLTVAQKITAFQNEYPHVSVWVTSRVYGYTPAIALPRAQFEHVRIADLDDNQVDDFLARWYMIHFPEDGLRQERDERRGSLRDAVFRSPRVRALAGCPLLLTLMAYIHRVVSTLPQDRAELYDQCVTMLLQSWQEARRGARGEIEPHAFERVGLHPSDQRDYLAHLAMFIQERNESEHDDQARGLIARTAAIECLAKRHFEVAGRENKHLKMQKARDDMQHFLDYIGDRTGLLLDRGGGKLSFIHLSFQEYLAAWLFMTEPKAHDNLTFFSRYLGRATWEEVLLLRLYIIRRVPGGGGEDAFDAVMSRVFRKLEQKDDPQGWLTLLRALRDNLDIRADQRQTILNRAIAQWLTQTELSGTWCKTLEEVKLFSTRAAPTLRELLVEKQAHGSSRDAIASLHLEARLFGLTAEAAERFSKRADLSSLLLDLVVFMSDQGFAALLAEKASAEHWAEALAALDSPQAYAMTVSWATGKIACPVAGAAPLEGAVRWMQSKLGEEAASRKRFADAHRRSNAKSLFATAGTILAKGHSYEIVVPLGGLREFSDRWTIGPTAERTLLCASLAAEHLAIGWKCGAAEQAWAHRVEGWITSWFRSFPRQGGTSDPALLVGAAQSFGPEFRNEYAREWGRNFSRYFGHEFVRYFGREFGRGFLCYFAQEFLRDFGREFLRDFGREFLRDFEREFLRDYIREFGREFVDKFRREFRREFVNEFARDLDVDPDAPDAEAQLEHALDDEQNVVRLLIADGSFWDWLFIQVMPSVEYQTDPCPTLLRPELWQNPLYVPLVLADMFSVAAWHHILCVGRHFAALLRGEEEIPDEDVMSWFSRHPIDVYPVGWCWDDFAQTIETTYGKLEGPRGALAMLHAQYASLMTGISVEEPGSTWRKLIDARAPDVDACLENAVSLSKAAAFIDPAPPRLKTKRNPTAAKKTMKPNEAMPIFTWLHISDIHVGHPDAKHAAALSLILKSLRSDIKTRDQFGFSRVDAIFVTGDITWSGKPDQYEKAKAHLLEIAHLVDVKPDHIFVVPGNHDVDRDVDKKRNVIKSFVNSLRSGGSTLDDAFADEDSRKLLASRQAAYLDFAKHFAPVCSMSPMAAPEDRLFWHHVLTGYGKVPIRILGLNTALAAADDQDKGKLYLGTTPWSQSLATANDDELIIVLSHHPFAEGWLGDQKDAKFEAQSRTHVHLCGHVHEAESEYFRRGGGSGMVRIVAGAVQGDKGAPAEHGYSLGAVVPEKYGKPGYVVRIYPRRWSDNNRDFRADTNVLPRNSRNPWAEHEIPRLGRE